MLDNKSLSAVLLAVFISVMSLEAFAADVVSDVDEVDVRFLYVQPGQTLHNIVKRLYLQRKSEWPKITNDIVRMNPHAFVGGDATKMKAGVRLELPQRQKVGKFTKLANHVGDVLQSRGQALAVGRDSKSRKLVPGSHVYVGDKLITGPEGFLRLHMIDDAVLDLRCFSIMVIEDYAIKDTSGSNRSILNLLKGSLKKVTGDIGKWKEDVYQLKTPVASIGVRGTEYALRVFQSKGCDGTIDLDDNGLYLQVAKGLIDVTNRSGSVSVSKGNNLYIPLPDGAPAEKNTWDGILNPMKEDSNFWWYLLAVVALAVAL